MIDMDPQGVPTAEDVSRKPQPRLGRDALVASICGFVVVLMVGASYAAVPFYNWFCRATGFNGTTQVATAAPSGAPLERTIAVRFDSNVAGGLPWKFVPEQTEIEVKIGQVVTVFYTVTNLSARTTAGQAAYNVAPLTVGAFLRGDFYDCVSAGLGAIFGRFGYAGSPTPRGYDQLVKRETTWPGNIDQDARSPKHRRRLGLLDQVVEKSQWHRCHAKDWDLDRSPALLANHRRQDLDFNVGPSDAE